jgi:hypothetical protein
VKYSDARSGIEDADVLLFRGRGRFSRLIQWATRSSYSHAGLAVWFSGRLMVAESRELRGCRIVPLSNAIGSATVCRFVPMPWVQVDRERVVDSALARLGAPYGWAHILRIGLAHLPLWLLRRIPVIGKYVPGGRQWSEDDQAPSGRSLICSEYVAACYRAGGVDLVPRLSDQDTTPGDLARSAALGFAGEVEP